MLFIRLFCGTRAAHLQQLYQLLRAFSLEDGCDALVIGEAHAAVEHLSHPPTLECPDRLTDHLDPVTPEPLEV